MRSSSGSVPDGEQTGLCCCCPFHVDLYNVLKDGVVFKDLGVGYYNQFNRERKIKSYLKKQKALGWEAPIAMDGQPA